jgi:hypothetical protein
MPTQIAINAQLPLVWSPESAVSPDEGILLLRVLSLLEAAHPHVDEDDSPEAMRWQALEARVDLCLQLLGQLLINKSPSPPLCAVELTGEHVAWLASHQHSPGESGCVSLWLSSRIPQALRLPATISEVSPLSDGWRVVARLRIDNDELQDWLDKTIFRRHRREVHELRQQQDA